jgi:hypothetical protein
MPWEIPPDLAQDKPAGVTADEFGIAPRRAGVLAVED